MHKYSVNIIIIPIKTKLRIINYIHQQSYIVGYKKLNKDYKAPLLEFKDYTRVWMLKNEIKINTR